MIRPAKRAGADADTIAEPDRPAGGEQAGARHGADQEEAADGEIEAAADEDEGGERRDDGDEDGVPEDVDPGAAACRNWSDWRGAEDDEGER